MFALLAQSSAGVAMGLLAVACIAAVQVFVVYYLWQIKDAYRKQVEELRAARISFQNVVVQLKETIQAEMNANLALKNDVQQLIRGNGGIITVQGNRLPG